VARGFLHVGDRRALPIGEERALVRYSESALNFSIPRCSRIAIARAMSTQWPHPLICEASVATMKWSPGSSRIPFISNFWIVDNFSLAGEIGVGNRGRSPHPTACAARELPCRGRGAPHDGSDLVERHGEHVVQHDREPLDGSQRFEYHEQRETDRVGQ